MTTYRVAIAGADRMMDLTRAQLDGLRCVYCGEAIGWGRMATDGLRAMNRVFYTPDGSRHEGLPVYAHSRCSTPTGDNLMTIRAKFFCSSMESALTGPVAKMVYNQGQLEPSEKMTWPRTYRFYAAYDSSVPEDQRYAEATPSGNLQITVDNPAVAFEPGKHYYLDFTEVALG